MTELLFVGGPSRTGTTALAEYLNAHEEILVCRERYKYVRDKVTPSNFTFERILDYEPGQGKDSGTETNTPREYHAALLARKDPARLRWIGDKYPNYVRWLDLLRRNNPGAKFILTYRPVEEVAASYEKRSKDAEDPWLGGKDGFKIGIQQWNEAMRRTRDFIENLTHPPVLIIGYHDFFFRSEEFVPLLSRFLDLEFGAPVRRSWHEMSGRFEDAQTGRQPLSEEQESFLDQHRDREAERWVLDRMGRQWDEPELYASRSGYDSVVATGGPRGLSAAAVEGQIRVEHVDRELTNLRQRAGELKRKLAEQERETNALKEDNQDLRMRAESLARKLQGILASRRWRFLTGLGRMRKRASGGSRGR